MITTLGKICWTSHFQCNRLPLRNKISPPQQKILMYLGQDKNTFGHFDIIIE